MSTTILLMVTEALVVLPVSFLMDKWFLKLYAKRSQKLSPAALDEQLFEFYEDGFRVVSGNSTDGFVRYNRIVWDFMIGMIGEKFRSQDFEFSRKDLNVFFSHLQEQNDDIAGWSESTVNKIKQVLTKALVEVKILDTFKSTRLNPLFLCDELEEGIRRNNDLEALAAFNCFR